MRVLRGEDLHLVGWAPDGGLSDILRRTRPVTRAGSDGACSGKTLESSGVVWNQREETQRFHDRLTTIEGSDQEQQAFQQELARICSTAVLPLFHQKRLIGTWVIDSSKEFFFTERRLRIVNAIAEFLGTMVGFNEGEYYRAVFSDYRERLQEARPGDWTDRLDRVLQLLCEITSADWAALFVWHESLTKLVLQASSNWYERMEGKACFELGEGWTGRLATQQDDIRILNASSGGAGIFEKYRNFIEPPAQRGGSGAQTPRIGLKLTAGGALVGVVTLGYYEANASRLTDVDEPALNVLRDAAHEIALSVIAVKQKAERERQERLHSTKEKVATLLITASKPEADWQEVLDELHEGFPSGHVTLYLVRDDGIELGWTSGRVRLPAGTGCVRWKDYTTLSDLVTAPPEREIVLLVSDQDDPLLAQWPFREDVRSLLAVPVHSLAGRVCGVLEFVNRRRLQPTFFGFFDEIERRAAWDVAQMLGAALSMRDYRQAFNQRLNRLETATRIAATGLFGARVMHELMSPFTRIQRAVDLLRRSAGGDRETYLRMIEAQKDHAAGPRPSSSRREARACLVHGLKICERPSAMQCGWSSHPSPSPVSPQGQQRCRSDGPG